MQVKTQRRCSIDWLIDWIEEVVGEIGALFLWIIQVINYLSDKPQIPIPI